MDSASWSGVSKTCNVQFVGTGSSLAVVVAFVGRWR